MVFMLVLNYSTDGALIAQFWSNLITQQQMKVEERRRKRRMKFQMRKKGGEVGRGNKFKKNIKLKKKKGNNLLQSIGIH